MIYFILTSPRIAGLGYAWLSGLFLDVLRGMVLGQHAFGFLVVGFLTHSLQLRMRMFPMLHQAATVMLLLASLSLHHFLDRRPDRATTTRRGVRWLPIISGALLWPLIVAVGDSLVAPLDLSPRDDDSMARLSTPQGPLRRTAHVRATRGRDASVRDHGAAGALVARLFYLQVLRFDYFSELSQGNRIRIEPIPPPRGLIIDRNGIALALNRPAYQLELTREQTPDLDETLDAARRPRLLAPAEDSTACASTIMARRSSMQCRSGCSSAMKSLRASPCIGPTCRASRCGRGLTRFYPGNGSAVHALGYVGAISEQDQERIDIAELCRHDVDRQARHRTQVRGSSCTATPATSSCS